MGEHHAKHQKSLMTLVMAMEELKVSIKMLADVGSSDQIEQALQDCINVSTALQTAIHGKNGDENHFKHQDRECLIMIKKEMVSMESHLRKSLQNPVSPKSFKVRMSLK